MKKNFYPYFNMYTNDGSNISFEHWQNDLCVDMHRHNFDELLLIDRGTCRHMFNKVETLLIPGDAVIVAKHHEHGFIISGEVSVYNCQFNFESLNERIKSALAAGKFFLRTPEDFLDFAWEKYLARREDHYKKEIFPNGIYELNINKQGVIHLAPSDYAFVTTILRHGLEEQIRRRENFSLIKQHCLELLLLEIKQAIDF